MSRNLSRSIIRLTVRPRAGSQILLDRPQQILDAPWFAENRRRPALQCALNAIAAREIQYRDDRRVVAIKPTAERGQVIRLTLVILAAIPNAGDRPTHKRRRIAAALPNRRVSGQA
jgi:hypothetical protein